MRSCYWILLLIIIGYTGCVTGSRNKRQLLDNKSTADTLSAVDSVEENSAADSLSGPDNDPPVNEEYSLSPASELMVKSCDNYLRTNPESPKVPEVMSLKASVYYNNKLYDKSRNIYTSLINKHPDVSQTVDAVRMIAQSYYMQESFNKAQQWYRKLRDMSGEEGDKTEATERIAQSIFRMAEMYESREDYQNAAEQYERVSLEFPFSSIADVSLFNSGLAFEKLTEWNRAVFIYRKIEQKYPKSKIAHKAMFRTAKCHEKLQEWKKAAESYLRLVSKWPKSEFTEAGLYNAGFCFENAGNLAEAAATFEKMAYSFPESEDAAKVLFKAGELYGKIKDWPGVAKVNREFTSRYGDDIDHAVQALCMVGVSLYMQGKDAKAIEQLEKAVSTYRKLRDPSDVNKYYSAKAQFTLAEIYHNAHNSIKLTYPRSTYNKQLRTKTDMLDKSVKEYSRVLEYGISEWTTRTIFQIGKIYEDFGIGIFSQKRSPGLSIDDQFSLELGIAQAVEKYFIEFAWKYHEKNVKLSINEKIDNKYTVNSKKKLTYLPYTAGKNYLNVVDVISKYEQDKKLDGFALIARKLETLQRVAPFKRQAMKLFMKSLEAGSKYSEEDKFYNNSSRLITKTSFSIGEIYDEISSIARSAPVPGEFDPYEEFVYKTRLLTKIEPYEDSAFTNYMKTVQIAKAYSLDDSFVNMSKNNISKILFIRGRSYDLLCESAFYKPPFPSGISESEKDLYRARFEEIAFKFQDKALSIYRDIINYSDEGFASGQYVDHAYVRLFQEYPSKVGVEKEKREKKSFSSGPKWKCHTDLQPGWYTMEFEDESWYRPEPVKSREVPQISGFPEKTPTSMWYGLKNSGGNQDKPDRLFFRREFYVTEVPFSAELYITAVDEFTVFLNNEKIAIDSDSLIKWNDAVRKDLTGRIRKGRNVIAVSVKNNLQIDYGLFPYLSVEVTKYDYFPRLPHSGEVLSEKSVEKGAYTFPYIHNFDFKKRENMAVQPEKKGEKQ